MRAAVFEQKGKISMREVPRPTPGPGEALIRVTLTTICGTDIHILRGEYPVKQGLVIGHEPAGVVEAVGLGVKSKKPTTCSAINVTACSRLPFAPNS